MSDLVIRRVEWGTEDHGRSVDLRRRILRWPLGLDLSDEDLAGERNEIVLIALADGSLAGTLNLVVFPDGHVKMRQVAVEPSVQRKGVGRGLVLESESVGRLLGATRMELHARDTAVPFYMALGYSLEGEPFEEVTIPHQKLVKCL